MSDHETAARLASVCDRLASTQRNMPVPLSEQEHTDLRDAAALLRGLGQQLFRQAALAKLTKEERHVLGL